jgi:hypothetical protein
MWVLIDSRLLQILECRLCIVLPHLLQFGNLSGSHLTTALLFLLGGHLDQPGEKTAVGNQRLPLLLVPGMKGK